MKECSSNIRYYVLVEEINFCKVSVVLGISKHMNALFGVTLQAYG